MKKSNIFLLLSSLFALSPGLLKCDEINNFAQALEKISQPVIVEGLSAEVLEIIKDNADLFALVKQDKDFLAVLGSNLAKLLVHSDCIDCIKYLKVKKTRKAFTALMNNVDFGTDPKKIATTLKDLAEKKEPTEDEQAEKIKTETEELKNSAQNRLNNLFNDSDLDVLLEQASSDDSYDEKLMKKTVAKAVGVKLDELTSQQFVLKLFEWTNTELYDSVKHSSNFLNALAKKPETIVTILDCDNCVEKLKVLSKEKLDVFATAISKNEWDNFDNSALIGVLK